MVFGDLKVGKVTSFEMLEPFRQLILRRHKFYVDQATVRLFTQFDNIKEDAYDASDEWLSDLPHHFDPDGPEAADLFKRADDIANEHYHLLIDIHERSRLSVLTGIYHEWEKQFRTWILDHIKHWRCGESALSRIRTANVRELAKFFASLGWDFEKKCYFKKLDACRLIVNVSKHGDGASLNQLKKHYSKYLINSSQRLNGILSDVNHLDHTVLKVSDEHIREFSAAIAMFWQDVPEQIVIVPEASLPNWFERAVESDRKANNDK